MTFSSDVPVVIQSRTMALPDNAGGVKDGLCKHFANFWQWILSWNHLQSQYRTNLEGQDINVSPPSSQNRYTNHCAGSDISVVKLSTQSIPQIDSDIWLTRCFIPYLKRITCCLMVSLSSWTLIVPYQTSNLIKQMENLFLNCICLFEVIP